MDSGIIRGALGESHFNGPGHPERPERTLTIDKLLSSLPYYHRLAEATARHATDDEVCLAHSSSYLGQLAASRNREVTIFDLDTRATSTSFDAALLAAGGALVAVEHSVAGPTRQWFVPVRPPGHHAERGAAMGFCLLNNVAIAAAAAVANLGLQRVAIVDWDVHHGNGTQHIFTDRADVLYISVHQSPHYPGTGRVDEVGTGDGAGYTANVPLSAGSDDSDYAAVFERVVLPILDQYRPDLILVSAGFDAHHRDSLSGMRVSDLGFSMMTHSLQEIARKHAECRIVFVLEGGYDLQGLREGVRAVVDCMAGQAPETPHSVAPGNLSIVTIDEAIRYLSPHWKL